MSRNEIDMAWAGSPGPSEREFYQDIIDKYHDQMEEEKPNEKDFDSLEEYEAAQKAWLTDYDKNYPVIPSHVRVKHRG
jgi:hypothetical protein